MDNSAFWVYFAVLGVIAVVIMVLSIICIVWAVVDSGRFSADDYEDTGFSRILVVLLILLTGAIGLVVYAAWMRPRLVAAQRTRVSAE